MTMMLLLKCSIRSAAASAAAASASAASATRSTSIALLRKQPLSTAATGATATPTATATATATASVVELPTRHSIKQPPRMCQDAIELAERTQQILETPVGQLYAKDYTTIEGSSSSSSASASSSASKNSSPQQQHHLDHHRDAAYDLAHSSIQLVEYLTLGHARTIPGTLHSYNNNNDNDNDNTDTADNANANAAMQGLLSRMQAEGDMYMELRHEKLMALVGQGDVDVDIDVDVDESSDSSDSDGSSDSNDSDSSDDSSDDKKEKDLAQATTKKRLDFTKDFAPPGPTIAMYDAVLDGLACINVNVNNNVNSNVNSNSNNQIPPIDLYNLAAQALAANDLDQGDCIYTSPTLVTYNAALRGIANAKYDVVDPSNNNPMDKGNEILRDDALSSAFGLYNHLTHSLHLPRNASTIIYMLQAVDQALPASRVKGNISVTFWDQACTLGVVTPELIQTIQDVHGGTPDNMNSVNGPEFELFVKQVVGTISKNASGGGGGGVPQKMRRFAQKYQHSKHY